MSDTPTPPVKIPWERTEDYREHYANSVQLRGNMIDFFLMFGVTEQVNEESVVLRFFQGVYLSPQQAKVLSLILQQNLAQYESAFGEIRVEQRQPSGPGGPVH